MTLRPPTINHARCNSSCREKIIIKAESQMMSRSSALTFSIVLRRSDSIKSMAVIDSLYTAEIPASAVTDAEWSIYPATTAIIQRTTSKVLHGLYHKTDRGNLRRTETTFRRLDPRCSVGTLGRDSSSIHERVQTQQRLQASRRSEYGYRSCPGYYRR